MSDRTIYWINNNFWTSKYDFVTTLLNFSRSLQFRSLLSRSSALVQGDQGGPTVRTLASIRALQSLIQTETFEWEQATSDENW